MKVGRGEKKTTILTNKNSIRQIVRGRREAVAWEEERSSSGLLSSGLPPGEGELSER